MTTLKIRKIRDPRTPVFCWYEIEATDTDSGATETLAVCDTREEARDTLKAIRGATT